MTTIAEKVSALIITYNEMGYIQKCIESVSFADEILVVDSYSTDGTYEYLLERVSETQGNFLRLIQCLTPGSYAARNEGIKIASGEFTAFTDSDCLVSDYWLSNLLACWNQYEGDIVVAGNVSFFSDTSKQTEQSALDFENMFSMKQDQNANSGKCITANLFCSMSLIKKHKGFNEKLKSGGDVEFSQRVVNSGGKIIWEGASSCVAFRASQSGNHRQ